VTKQQEYSRRYYLKHREKILLKAKSPKERQKKQQHYYKTQTQQLMYAQFARLAFPEKTKFLNLQNKARKYGFSVIEFQKRRWGKCKLCGFKQNPLRCDHDHKSGRVRGFLCARCNTALAWVEDTKWLRKALIYLLEE
jgi:recombination endonuclease VII